jgi:hypothetical protein
MGCPEFNGLGTHVMICQASRQIIGDSDIDWNPPTDHTFDEHVVSWLGLDVLAQQGRDDPVWI